MKCYECRWLDRSVVLTSYPPSYRCTLGLGTHHADHECEYEFMPVVRCEDCKYWASADRYCEILDTWFFATGFCSLGERKAEE